MQINDGGIYAAALAHFREINASDNEVGVWLSTLREDLILHDGGLQNLSAYTRAAADYLVELEG